MKRGFSPLFVDFDGKVDSLSQRVEKYRSSQRIRVVPIIYDFVLHHIFYNTIGTNLFLNQEQRLYHDSKQQQKFSRPSKIKNKKMKRRILPTPIRFAATGTTTAKPSSRRQGTLYCNRYSSISRAHSSFESHRRLWPVASSLRYLSSLPTPMPQNGDSRSDNNKTNTDASTNTAVSHQRSYLPIDFTTSSQISGEESQILEVHLRPNQILRAESGAMLYMTEGVNMETSMGLSGGSGGMSTGFTVRLFPSFLLRRKNFNSVLTF